MKTRDEKLPRPYCCPEPKCTPLHQLGEVNAASTGETFMCWGRMDRPVAFVYDGVDHRNDLNACTYTPLKGVIRYQENADDWRALVNGYGRAIAKAAAAQKEPSAP